MDTKAIQRDYAHGVLLDILRDPESFDMTRWYWRTPDNKKTPSCGCVASKVALRAGWKPVFFSPDQMFTDLFADPSNTRQHMVDHVARDVMQMDPSAARELFWTSSRIVALRVLDRAANGEEISLALVREEKDRWETDSEKLTYNKVIAELRDKYDDELNPVTTTVYDTDTYFVLQRLYISAKGEKEWVDSSANYYREEGREAAVMQLDELRKTFGNEVRMVRRDLKITETPVG